MNKQLNIMQTPSAEAFTQLVLKVFQLNGRLLAAGDRLTNEIGITSALWQVLGAINEAPLPLAQIARNMGLTRQGVRRTANVLKDKGLVEFHDNPNHQRSKLVVLTAMGRNVLDEATELQINWSNSISNGLDENKLKTAIQTMDSIFDRL